jgi:hypothetical protein
MRTTKKILFSVVLILLMYGACEVVAFLFHLVTEREVFSFSRWQSYRLFLLDPNASKPPPTGNIPVPSIQNEVIHPYLGFVINPRERPGYSEQGFPGENPLTPANTPHHFGIAIFGGSFAENTSTWGRETILTELKKSPLFADKDFHIYTFALGGYKQPQQLLALTYFLALGAKIDLVLNLDGFNEVALAPAENAGKVYPFYPRGWPARVNNFIDPKKLTLIAQLYAFDEKKRAWAKLFATTPLRYSVLANLVWKSYHLRLANQQMFTSQALERYNTETQGNLAYIASGPTFNYATEAALYADLVNAWKNCALQMAKLCESKGIPYFHFLQPNQYVPGSKIMTAKEKEIAIQPDHPYKKGVEQGYPLLRKAGQELSQQGVKFYDLTMIFAQNDEVLYSDSCCHVNERGYHLIGEAIGKAIMENYKD